MQIDCDFPSGNIVVDAIDGDTVRLHQDLRDTEGDWFYWHFRVRGPEGRTVRFHFTQSNVIGTRGPCASNDGGKNWTWLGLNAQDCNAFHYSFGPQSNCVHFAFCIPYVETNLREFLNQHRASNHVRVSALCKSKKGREIELLNVGKLAGEPEFRMLLTGRAHACEAAASFVLEGMLAAALADDELGRWYQSTVEILAIPFLDKDGVEDGDQGKNRKPHDHNRDYWGDGIYPSVTALRRMVPDWSRGRLRVALDLHCPWIRSNRNEAIYFVGAPAHEKWAEIERLSSILERTQRGPLTFKSAENLPFGMEWNTYDGPLITGQRWALKQPGVTLALTLEFPYANNRDQTISVDNARAFGRDLMSAIREYLTTNQQ